MLHKTTNENNFSCFRAGMFFVLGINALAGFAVAAWHQIPPAIFGAGAMSVVCFIVSFIDWDTRNRSNE